MHIFELLYTYNLMVLSDYDETGQWAPGVYEEKLAEHNRERAIKDKQEADYKESWSAANWTKAMVAMISLDEGAWTALASGTVDDFLMDSTKTTPEEFALQVSMLAVIVIAGKAGEVGGAKSGRASSSRSVTTAEIYEQARAEGIDLPTDNAFELRINELTREFNAQTPAAKRATIQNGLDIRLSEAQTRFDSADTPLLKSQRKMKLDEANTLKNKFLGDFAKSDEGLAKAKGKADDYSGSGMLFETESSGSYTKSKAFKPSELKEMESEGLLARQRSRAAEEVAKAAKARADARKSTSEKIEKQKQDLETFGKKARDTEKEKPPLKTSEIEDGLDDALDPSQENPTPQMASTPDEPIDIFLKNNPEATETEINNFKAKSPEIQKYINDFRAKYTPEQIARGLEATRKARETRKAADEAAEYIKNNPEEPSETDPLIEKDEPELKEDPKPGNTKVYPEDNPLLDKLEAQGVQLTQLEIDRLRDEFGFDYVNELNPAEPTETTGDPRDLLDYDEQDGELTAAEKKELLDKYGFDFDEELNAAEPTDTTPDPPEIIDADEVETDEPNPSTTEEVINETGNERDSKGPPTGKQGPTAAETAAAAALIIGQAQAGVVPGSTENQDEPGSQPEVPSNINELGSATGDEFKIKNTLITRNIDELLDHSLKLSRRVYAGKTLGNIETDTADYEGQNDRNYILDGLTIPVLINVRKGIVYVAFQGTDSWSNIITDIRSGFYNFNEITLFRDRMNLSEATDIRVHAGNMLALKNIYQTVREELDKFFKEESIVFTGHSLGGVMATLFYFAYVNDTQNPEKKLPVTNCITWGSPRFLKDTEENIRNYNSSCPNVIRVFNEKDIVPYLPFRRCLNDNWMIALMEKIFYAQPGVMVSPIDICGFVHVGIPLNLDSNIAYNDVNNLIALIFDGGSSIIKDIINNTYSDKDIRQNGLLNLILNKNWREALLLGTIKCIPFVEELQPVNKVVLSRYILNNVGAIRDYNEKCDVLKPLDLADFMKMVGTDVCGETEYQQDVNLTILAGVSAQAASNFAKFHRLSKYEELLEKLIFNQLESKKSILNRADAEGNIYIKQSDYDRNQEQKQMEIDMIRKNKFKLPSIIGIYEGNFDNYDFIEY